MDQLVLAGYVSCQAWRIAFRATFLLLEVMVMTAFGFVEMRNSTVAPIALALLSLAFRVL